MTNAGYSCVIGRGVFFGSLVYSEGEARLVTHSQSLCIAHRTHSRKSSISRRRRLPKIADVLRRAWSYCVWGASDEQSLGASSGGWVTPGARSSTPPTSTGHCHLSSTLHMRMARYFRPHPSVEHSSGLGSCIRNHSSHFPIVWRK